MTPFEPVPLERTATISLNKAEERLVRAGTANLADPFENALVASILKKLVTSLRIGDILLGPVGHTNKEPKPRTTKPPLDPAAGAALLKSLGLL